MNYQTALLHALEKNNIMYFPYTSTQLQTGKSKLALSLLKSKQKNALDQIYRDILFEIGNSDEFDNYLNQLKLMTIIKEGKYQFVVFHGILWNDFNKEAQP